MHVYKFHSLSFDMYSIYEKFSFGVCVFFCCCVLSVNNMGVYACSIAIVFHKYYILSSKK